RKTERERQREGGKDHRAVKKRNKKLAKGKGNHTFTSSPTYPPTHPHTQTHTHTHAHTQTHTHTHTGRKEGKRATVTQSNMSRESRNVGFCERCHYISCATKRLVIESQISF